MNFFIFLAIIGELVKTDGLKTWCDQMEQLCFFTLGMKKYVSNINEAHELCIKEDTASMELDMYNKYILYSVIRFLETTEFNKKVSRPPFYFIVKSWHENREPCSRPAVNYDVEDTTYICPDRSITQFNVVCMMNVTATIGEDDLSPPKDADESLVSDTESSWMHVSGVLISLTVIGILMLVGIIFGIVLKYRSMERQSKIGTATSSEIPFDSEVTSPASLFVATNSESKTA